MKGFRAALVAGSALASTMSANAWSQSAPQTATGSPATTDDDADAPATDVVVTGLRASLESARNVKRTSDSIVDTVVAEDLGQLPDNSATEALARLPGVQVFRNRGEGQALTVRGLSQVLTTLNGQESYNGSSRRSLLNTYPAGLLRSVTVYKALTPDLIEGGIGGAIDVQLRQPFDFKKGLVVAGTLRGSYDDQARKVFYNGDVLLSDRWQTGIGEMGLLLNASYLRRDYFESYRENFGPQNSGATQSVSPAGLGTIQFPTTILVKQPYGNYRRPVLTGSFQWKPASNFRMDLRVTQINDKNTYFDNDLQTAIANTTPLTNVVLVPGTNIVKSATFTPTAAAGPRSSYNQNYIRTTQGEFGLQWITGRATISSNVVYTRSKQSVISRLFLLSFRTPQQINAVFQSDSKFGGLSYNYTTANLTDPSIFYVRAYSDALSEAKGEGVQWRTDLDLDTGGAFFRALKTGFRYAERSTNFQSGTRLANLDALKLGLSAFPGGSDAEISPSGFRGDDVTVPDSWIQYRASLLGDATNYSALNRYVSTLTGTGVTGTALFTTDRPTFDPISGFKGSEKSYAYYAQTKYGIDLGGVTIDGVAGARIVNTVLNIDGTRVATQRNAAGVITVTNTPINGRQNYLDVDPSISAVAHFGRNVQLRAAWTKTFSRPDFAQLNPSLNLVETTTASRATGGNPDLRPIRSTNWDASLEWYFGRAGSASAAVFWRDVNGFFVNAVTDEILPNALGAVTQVTRPVNAGDGTIKGFELAATTFFDFAPGMLKNFGAQANFTYIDTNQVLPVTAANPIATNGPITGISKTSVNTALFYDDGRFRARVAYSVRSRFILAYVLASPNANLDWYPISRLDASTSYRVNKNITLTIDGQNLLGKPQRSFWGNAALDDSAYQDRVYFEGRVISAAARFKF